MIESLICSRSRFFGSHVRYVGNVANTLGRHLSYPALEKSDYADADSLTHHDAGLHSTMVYILQIAMLSHGASSARI